MRFDSGPEAFARVNRNYVLTEYVLNENDCTTNFVIGQGLFFHYAAASSSSHFIEKKKNTAKNDQPNTQLKSTEKEIKLREKKT